MGFRFVWGHAVIFPFLMMDFGANIFGTVRSLFPIYARDILAVGPQGLGILYAASAAGALLGAFGFSLWGSVRRAGRWILIGVTLYGLCLLFFATSHIFWLSILLLIGSGIGDTISAILRSTINQLSTPDELRGRMASINSVFTNSGPQLGQFQAGVLAALIGAELAATSGALIILMIVGVLVARFPYVRDYRINQANRGGRSATLRGRKFGEWSSGSIVGCCQAPSSPSTGLRTNGELELFLLRLAQRVLIYLKTPTRIWPRRRRRFPAA